jgi:tetratricopeptide (TPR) repeat protein
LVLAEAQDGEARYRLLETIREYGAEKLIEAGEAEAYRTRLRDWCRDLALRASPNLRGREQQAWLTRLERENANLCAALAWTIERPDIAGEEGLRLAAELVQFWYMHGHIGDGRRWLEQVLSVEPAAPAALRARALNNVAGLALAQGDFEAARVRYEQSLTLYRELEDSAGIARGLSNLGVLEGRLGNRARSRALQEEGLDLYRACENTSGTVNALNNLGDLAQKQGDLAAARSCFDEALTLAMRVGDRWSVGIALMGLGDVAAKQGDPVAARMHFSQSLGEAQGIGDKLNIAECLARLASLLTEDQPAQAVRLLAAAEALREVIGASLEPGRQATVDGDVARARAALDRDEFVAAWADGRAMGQGAAIALALADTLAT